MLKTSLTFILSLLISVTVCGQLLTPKRIVFLGDTGIFFTKKQEIELLVKFKQFEGCKLEKAKWEKYAIDADLQIDREREAYNYLNKEYDNLMVVSKDFEKKYNDEYVSHENTKIDLSKANVEKNRWIKATFITGGISLVIISPLVYLLAR